MSQLHAIVSCDIVGHSRQKSWAAQLAHLQGINERVRGVLERNGAGRTIWASRGDGGHVVFRGDDWVTPVFQFILELHAWSQSVGIPLRIIAHHGEVHPFTGADGRTELVGDAINLVGRLIEYAAPGRVVVSADFVTAATASAPPDIRFHDPAPVWPKYFPQQTVFLLSKGPDLCSEWGTAGDDRAALRAAQAGGEEWEVLYHAKRLFQVNSGDPAAEQAVRDVEPNGLRFRNHESGRAEVNPILGRLDSYPRVEFVRAAQLIERQDGDQLCEFGAAGDTMFVILRGLIRITPPGQTPSLRSAGDFVGELAFALHRSRTAAMQCVGRTALLGFTYQHLDAQFGRSAAGVQSREQLDRVLLTRVLRYLCLTADYLKTADPGSPLHESNRPWEAMLYHSARLPRFEDGAAVSFADPRFADDGFYVLVSGQLQAAHPPSKVLRGEALPVVYAAVPDRYVSVNCDYRVEGEATVVFVGLAAFKSFGPTAVKGVAEGVKRAARPQFVYDVFLSYTFDDQETVLRWKAALQAAGLRVYMDTANLMRRFPEQVAAAILDSLVMVTFISANTMRRKPEDNWVRREIEYREANFDPETANVLPVRLTGGHVAAIAHGFVSVDADGREADAVREVVNAVRDVADGRLAPPFTIRRRAPVSLRGPG